MRIRSVFVDSLDFLVCKFLNPRQFPRSKLRELTILIQAS